MCFIDVEKVCLWFICSSDRVTLNDGMSNEKSILNCKTDDLYLKHVLYSEYLTLSCPSTLLLAYRSFHSFLALLITGLLILQLQRLTLTSLTL
jgi:hypothetical protein